MSDRLNHAAVVGGRNGTSTHTVHPDGTGGTVVGGSAFTPTSGRLLLCLVDGAVTSTTPTGWTLPTNGSAVANTGLYVFYRTASGTSADQVATTHNGADHPVGFDFYEFAAGSAWGSGVASTGVANGGTGPNLTGLTGASWVAGVVASGGSSGTNTTTWDVGVKDADVAVANAATDGFNYSLAYQADYVSGSAQTVATLTNFNSAAERLQFAITVATPGVAPGVVIEFTKVI